MAVGPLAIFLSLYSLYLFFQLLLKRKAPPSWNRRLQTKDALLVFGSSAALSTVLFGLLSMLGVWNAGNTSIGSLVAFSAVLGAVFAILVELLLAATLNAPPPAWGAANFVTGDLPRGKRFSRGVLALAIALSLTWVPYQFLTVLPPSTPIGNASVANAFELLFGKYPLGIAWASSFALGSLVLLSAYAVVLSVLDPRLPSQRE
jgi:hypothetical protein